MIRHLSVTMRNGFILAKAVRIASIAQPENIESFELQETIKTDDVISSFALKACLFGINKYKDEFDDCLTPHDVAVKMYEQLGDYLNGKQIYSSYSLESSLDCAPCKVERGFCKRRKLMLSMVHNILHWLKEHKSELTNMDFVDDITFCETKHTCGLDHNKYFKLYI